MPKPYKKVTPAMFEELLQEGRYTTLLGTHRAIGRMTTWTDPQRAKARKIADKYFEENQLVIPAKALSDAERRNTSREKTAQKRTVVKATMVPTEGEALLTFAKDIRSLRGSQLKLSFLRVLHTMEKSGISPKEIAAAIA